MIDGLINFIENGSLEVLSRFFILYLLVLWILFPVWVYLDAKKRYESSYIASIFFIFILPFNLPGFIFYLIIRPDNHHDAHIQGADNYDGAVNIPVANFINDKGIMMSLNLTINNEILKHDQSINMNVNFDADKELLQTKQLVVNQPATTPSIDVRNPSIIKDNRQAESFLNKFTSKLKQNLQVILSVIKNTDMSSQSTTEASSDEKKDNHQKLDIK